MNLKELDGIRRRIAERRADGAPMGNQNAAGPHNMGVSSAGCKELNSLNSSATNGGKGDKAKAKQIFDKAPVGQKLYCKGERGATMTWEKTGDDTWNEYLGNDPEPIEMKSSNLASKYFSSNGFRSAKYVEVSNKPFDDDKGSKNGGKKASPGERRKFAAQASGNQWARENWNATH